MELTRWICLVFATICLVFTVVSNAPLAQYFDFYSMIIVAFGCAGIVVFNFGELGWFFKTAIPRFCSPRSREALSLESSLKAARIARTVGDQALIIGSLGTLIGGLQMLQNLTDINAVGPALAVAFLTNLYAILIVVLFSFPVNRFFLAEANDGAADSSDTMIGVHAQVWSTAVVLVPMGTLYVNFG